MDRVPEPLLDELRRYGQEHVLAWWPELEPAQRRGLVEQIEDLNLPELQSLYERRDEKATLPSADAIVPLPRQANDLGRAAEHRRRGEEAFARGEVAFLVVAGGQERLGFDQPKGLFPVGPVSGKSLFQIHAEKVLALQRRYGKELPLLVMTSHATHDTLAFFEANQYFGLPRSAVRFFQQGTMSALDLATGRLLLEAKDRLFLGPNGHGGSLTGLAAEHRLIDWLGQRGVRTIYYFQVDNPLVKLSDFEFIGRHLAQPAEVSSKVVAKQHPTEKLGNLALVDGRCTIIEYSDLPEALARATDEQGRPRLWAGSPAIHLFDLAFLERMTGTASNIPWHVARKKVPHLAADGSLVQPDKENALKFERFIFDVLPHAERWAVMETTREEEFEPLKNATGPESPATVKQALLNLAGRWLEENGVAVARDDKGQVAAQVEISPLLALESADLKGKVPADMKLDRPTYLE